MTAASRLLLLLLLLLFPLPAVLRLESYRLGPRVLVGEPRVLVGEETDSGLEFSTAAEGRQKPPPSLYKCFIAHVEGGAAAHISSMTSSWFDSQSEWEGRDEEREVPLCLVCGWTMNSWVLGSISLTVSPKSVHHVSSRGRYARS